MSYLGLCWKMRRAPLHGSEVQMNISLEQESQGSDKCTQADGARGINAGDALLQFAVLWWAARPFNVTFAAVHCEDHQEEWWWVHPSECTAWGSQSLPAWPCCPAFAVSGQACHHQSGLCQQSPAAAKSDYGLL